MTLAVLFKSRKVQLPRGTHFPTGFFNNPSSMTFLRLCVYIYI